MRVSVLNFGNCFTQSTNSCERLGRPKSWRTPRSPIATVTTPRSSRTIPVIRNLCSHWCSISAERRRRPGIVTTATHARQGSPSQWPMRMTQALRRASQFIICNRRAPRCQLYDAQRIAFIRRRASVRRGQGVIRRINLVGLNRLAGGDYGDCKVTLPEVNRMAWSERSQQRFSIRANGGGAPSGLRWDGGRRIRRHRCPRPRRARARTAAPFDRCDTGRATSMVTVVPADRVGDVPVGSPRRHETGRCCSAGSARTRCVRRDAGTPPPIR